jgi:hypothetical protein
MIHGVGKKREDERASIVQIGKLITDSELNGGESVVVAYSSEE